MKMPPAARATATTTVMEAGPRDTGEWLAMRGALWTDATPEQHRAEMRELAGDSGFVAFIARDGGGRAVGFAEMQVRPYANGCAGRPVAFLEGIWVAPAARRRGVGRALVAAAEAWARRSGLTELASDALIENVASHLAHAGWGFIETERVVCFRKPLAASGMS